MRQWKASMKKCRREIEEAQTCNLREEMRKQYQNGAKESEEI